MTGSRACGLRSHQRLVHPSGPAQALNRKVWININTAVSLFVVGGREEDMGIGYGTKGTDFKKCGPWTWSLDAG